MQKQNQVEAVKPIVITKPRTSARYCGICGKRVFFHNEICLNCKTPIDWSEYERVKKDV